VQFVSNVITHLYKNIKLIIYKLYMHAKVSSDFTFFTVIYRQYKKHKIIKIVKSRLRLKLLLKR